MNPTNFEMYYCWKELQISIPSLVDNILIIGTRIAITSIKNQSSRTALEASKSNLKPLESSLAESAGGQTLIIDKFSFLPRKMKNASVTTKTNSAFVSKIVANDNLAKIISMNIGTTYYAFFNVGKALVWVDYDWSLKV